MSTKQNYINHITLLLDASGSMDHLKHKVVKVTDDLVAFLAKKSKEDNEETRISVYSFADAVECHIWDMDVFRLPSMEGLYRIQGMTAMADAVHQALDDTDLVPEKYGKHDFMFYLLTDGFENASRSRSGIRPAFGRTPPEVLKEEMQKRFASLPGNRSMLGLAPDDRSAKQLYEFGFAKGNVALWDASTEAGLEQAVEQIKTAHTSYVATRATTGVRGTRSAFIVGGQVDAAQVKAKLIPLAHTAYDLVPVTSRPGDESFEKRKKPTKKFPEGEVIGRFIRIDDFIRRINGGKFALGMGYYQLFSHGARTREKIQGNKEIAVLDKKTSQIYVGPQARGIVGLPEHDVTVAPDSNPDYEIFVRSTSENRHLPIGSRLLIMK